LETSKAHETSLKVSGADHVASDARRMPILRSRASAADHPQADASIMAADTQRFTATEKTTLSDGAVAQRVETARRSDGQHTKVESAISKQPLWCHE